MFSTAAARVKLPDSATAKKYSRCRRSMPDPNWLGKAAQATPTRPLKVSMDGSTRDGADKSHDDEDRQ